MEPFDYSQVPYGYSMCASADCPKAVTCLRHIALEHAPLESPVLPTLTPNALKAMKGDCKYYCPATKARYAKGFVHTVDALTVRQLNTFKKQLTDHYGRKYYFIYRRGDKLIKPADQKYIISVAKGLGLVLDNYFDDYVENYLWQD